MIDGHVAHVSQGACNPRACGLRDAAAYEWHGGARGRQITIAIEGVVGQVFGVSNGELLRATRGKAQVALARQVAMYLAHVTCRLSLTEVGVLFGRDRTTVAHACRVVEDRRDDPIFDRALELLEWAVPTLLAPRRASLSTIA